MALSKGFWPIIGRETVLVTILLIAAIIEQRVQGQQDNSTTQNNSTTLATTLATPATNSAVRSERTTGNTSRGPFGLLLFRDFLIVSGGIALVIILITMFAICSVTSKKRGEKTSIGSEGEGSLIDSDQLTGSQLEAGLTPSMVEAGYTPSMVEAGLSPEMVKEGVTKSSMGRMFNSNVPSAAKAQELKRKSSGVIIRSKKRNVVHPLLTSDVHSERYLKSSVSDNNEPVTIKFVNTSTVDSVVPIANYKPRGVVDTFLEKRLDKESKGSNHRRGHSKQSRHSKTKKPRTK